MLMILPNYRAIASKTGSGCVRLSKLVWEREGAVAALSKFRDRANRDETTTGNASVHVYVLCYSQKARTTVTVST